MCQCVSLTTYHSCSAETSRKSGVFTYPETFGHLGLLRGDLYLHLHHACLSVYPSVRMKQLGSTGGIFMKFDT